MVNAIVRFSATSLFVLGIALSAASAQTPPPTPPNAGQRPALARLMRTPYRPIVIELRGLKITPEQRQQIVAIFKAHQPDMKALGAKFRAARQAWQQSGKIDIAERKALTDQRTALLQAVRAEVVATLTPDQQKQLEARRARRVGRRG